MPFNGSGGFTPLAPPQFPAVAGTTVNSTYFNNVMNDIFTGLGQVVTRSGQSPWTANLPAGGFKISNLAAGSANGDSVAFGQAAVTFGTVTGNVTGNVTGTVTGHSTLDLALTGGNLTGNLGFNVASPTSPIDVLTTAGAAGITLRGRSSDNVSNFSFTDYGGTTGYGQLQGRSTDLRIAANSLPLTFFISATEAMRIDTAGNVGINGAPTVLSGISPSLQVRGNSTVLASLIVASSATGDSSVSLYSGITAADNPAIIWQNNLRFGTATNIGAGSFTERMRINAGGNVGIGTGSNSINALLNLRQDSGDGPMLMLENRAVSGILHKYGSLVFSPYRDVADPVYGAAIWAEGSSSAAYTADLVLGTSINGAASTFPAEQLRLDYQGNLGIGTVGVGLGTAKVHAISGATATPAFRAQTGGPNQGSILLGNNGFIYGGDDYGGVILAHNATNALKAASTGVVDIIGGSGKLTMAGGITRFESAEIATPTTTGLTATAHGGPRKPDQLRAVWRCKTAEGGWAVGDEVEVRNDVGDTSREYRLYSNGTNVGLNYVGSGIAPATRNTAGGLIAMTAANWKLVFYALWL